MVIYKPRNQFFRGRSLLADRAQREEWLRGWMGKARSLLHPHMVKQSVIVLQGTTVIPLLTSVLLDKTQWETPDEFNPNHFLDAEGNFVKKKAFLPFSTGNESIWSCMGHRVLSAPQKILAKWQDPSLCWEQHRHQWWGWLRNTCPGFWWLANSPSAHTGRHTGSWCLKTRTYRRLNAFKQEFSLPSALGRPVSRVSQINSLQTQSETALFKCL